MWPYTGNETIQFQDEMFVALETYSAAYCRLKELGSEAQEGIKLMEQYFQMAKRLTQIEDKRDPLLFSMGFGAANNINPGSRR